MPIHPKLLEVLVCPVTKLPVFRLDADRLERLNQSINAGTVENLAGKAVTETLTEALITSNNKTIYRVEQGVPVMLEDQAIAADQVAR